MKIGRRTFSRRLTAIAGGMVLGAEFLDAHFLSPDFSFDLHAHPGLLVRRGTPEYGGDDGVLKTIESMNAAHLTGAFFSLVADLPLLKIGPTGIQPLGPYLPNAGWTEYQRQLAAYRAVVGQLPVRVVQAMEELESARAGDKVAALLSCEGGDFLQGSLERLGEMYHDGVRSLQLVHYHPNEVGDLQTAPAQHHGLSKFGKSLVRRMNRLGMLIDVAHATYETTRAACDVSDTPVMLSHAILQTTDDRPMAARAISSAHAKLVAQTGGIIGAWPSGFSKDLGDFADQTLRLVDVVGIDHVGLGTDMDGNFKPVLTEYWQVNAWATLLQTRGLGTADVKKIVGGNARRLLRQVLH